MNEPQPKPTGSIFLEGWTHNLKSSPPRCLSTPPGPGATARWGKANRPQTPGLHVEPRGLGRGNNWMEKWGGAGSPWAGSAGREEPLSSGAVSPPPCAAPAAGSTSPPFTPAGSLDDDATSALPEGEKRTGRGWRHASSYRRLRSFPLRGRKLLYTQTWL